MSNPLRAAEWLANQPHCCGYPHYDGDLEDIPHSEKCPMLGRKEVTTSERAEAYAAYLLSELEREQREERERCRRNGDAAGSFWAGQLANDVAAFRKRVMGER